MLACISFHNCVLVTVCSKTNLGNWLNETGPTSWTQYSFNYTAGNPSPTLWFGFEGGSISFNVLDTVSVVDLTVPSMEILQNPGFENSSISPVGWVQWCQNSCSGGSQPGQVTSSNCRNVSGVLCYKDRCDNGFDFLGQTFSTIIGRTYRISFWLYQSGASAKFTFDIF